MAKIGGWEFDPATGDGTWTDEVARIHDIEVDGSTDLKRGLSFYEGESLKRIEQAIRDAVEFVRPYDLELELVTAKGARKWVRTIGSPVVENGKVVRVRGSFQDISERKLYEDRITHLNAVLRGIRNVNQLITREKDRKKLIQDACSLLVDARGFRSTVICLASDGRVTAYAMAGQNFGALQELLKRGELPDCAKRAMETSGAIVVSGLESGRVCAGCPAAEKRHDGHEVMVIRLWHDGRLFGFMLASIPVGTGGNLEEQDLMQEVAGDIAFALRSIEIEEERDKSQLALAATEEHMRQTYKLEAIGRLAGGVAHDFNNMLSVIIGYAQIVLGRLDNRDPLREDVKEIIAAGERSASLTRQLLAFSRKQTLHFEVVDLEVLLRNLEKMLRRLIGEDIKLEMSIADDVACVKVDHGQMEQVIMNLVVNARDAMPQGGKLSIEVSNETIADVEAGVVSGNNVKIVVSDTGCGMDEAVLSRVFEPFFTTKELGKGTGLGLSTVHGIIKQFGGEIDVASEKGKGTTFHIYLPSTDAKLEEKTEVRHADLVRNGAGKSILVVEDEASLRGLFVEFFAGTDFKLTIAANAGEALLLMEEKGLKPDLVITDVIMPNMSGTVLVERLRRRNPGLKILFMSGYTDSEMETQGVLVSGIPFIQKPFYMKDLAAMIEQALGS